MRALGGPQVLSHTDTRDLFPGLLLIRIRGRHVVVVPSYEYGDRVIRLYRLHGDLLLPLILPLIEELTILGVDRLLLQLRLLVL